MGELAWPLVVLVLGGAALIMARADCGPASKERRAKLDAQMASLDVRAEDTENDIQAINANIASLAKDIAELKRYREADSVLKLRGGR